MKKNLIILCAAVVLAIGIYGYFSATAAPGNDSRLLSKIEISPEFFDFGEVAYGKIAKYDFELKNIGEKDLEITRISTSCGCTTAEAGTRLIQPGEKTNLSVEYNTGAMSGPLSMGDQERLIYVRSNDPVNPQIEIKIHAIVK